jgi:cell division protein FtsL
MTTHSLQSTIKKYATRMMHSVISAVQNIYKKIMIMDRYEQVFVISLLVVTLLFMVSPLMTLSPNETDSSRQYIFLL